MNLEKIEDKLKKEIEDFAKEYGNKETIKEFEDKIIGLNNSNLSTFFALIPGADFEKHAKIVLDSGDIENIYSLSKYSSELEDYIIESKNFKYNFEWAKNLYSVEYLNVRQSGHLRNLKKDNLQRISNHIEAISKSTDMDGSLQFIEWFCDRINDTITIRSFYSTFDENVGYEILHGYDEYLNDVIHTAIGCMDAEKIYNCFKKLGTLPWEFAQKIDFVSVRRALIATRDLKYNGIIIGSCVNNQFDKEHEKVIIEDGSAEDNYLFAINVREADVLSHAKAVLNSGDDMYNYYFAKNVEGADILEHGKKVIESKNALYNYLFARDIKGADMLSHEKIVLESKDAKINYKFAKNVEGADMVEHKKVVAENGDAEYNYLCCLLGDGTDDYKNRVAVLNSKDVKYNFLLALKFPQSELFEKHYKAVLNSGDEEYINMCNKLKPNIESSINQKIKLLQKYR